MVKRLLKNKDNYKFSFSWVNLIAVLMVILPNIIWQIAPPNNNPIANWFSPYMMLNILEWVFRLLTLIIFIFVVNTRFTNSSKRSKYI